MLAKFNIFTLGDAMITLNPEETGPLRFVTRFERKIGGAELNFAIGCARLGMHAKWLSRLGEDEFGRVIYNFARGEGVDVSDVVYVKEYPTSLNFKEIREDGSGKTFYYRHQSPILTLNPEDITDEMFANIDLVHLTGVFLAIDTKNLDIAMRVIEIAKQKDIPLSFDPNIRLKLWSIEEARSAFMEIFPYTDILLAGSDEIRLIIGNDSEESLEKFATENKIGQLVIKEGANGSKVYSKSVWHKKEAFPVNPVDTVGAGDGFDAGYIYGYLNDLSIDDRLTFANGVGALVTTVSGDNEGLPYLDEVWAFIKNEAVIER